MRAARPLALLACALALVALEPARVLAQEPTAAGATAEPADDLSTPGPHAVVETVVSERVFPTKLQVFYPEGPGPHDVVVLLHGWGGAPSDQEPLARHLASRGFAVVLGGHPSIELNPDVWQKDVKANLDAVEAANADPKSPLHGKLDMDRVGVVGHSLGGATAIALGAADPRVKAVVALAPGTEILRVGQLMNHAQKVEKPLLVLGAEHDYTALSDVYGRRAFDKAGSSDRLFVELAGANHNNFASAPWWMNLLNVSDMPSWFFGGMSADTQLAETKRYTTAWLSRYLDGAADPAGLTDGRAARADMERGLVTRVEGGRPEAGATATADEGLPAAIRQRLQGREALEKAAPRTGMAEALRGELDAAEGRGRAAPR